MPASKTTTNGIIKLLAEAYNGEIETVMNYIASSVNLDGVRAEEVKASLGKDVTEELGHAQLLANRIRTLGGVVPGSKSLKWTQTKLQPPKSSTDVVSVIKGVIAAEEDAIDIYTRIIKASEGKDWVTQDMAITILSDEQEHRRMFVGFLKEYEKSAT
jgi:bacterioferritin